MILRRLAATGAVLMLAFVPADPSMPAPQGAGIGADVAEGDIAVWNRVQQGLDDLGRNARQLEYAENPYAYTRVFACNGNSPTTGQDGGCQAAADACPEDAVLYWLYRAPAGTNVGQLGWEQYDSRCLAPTIQRERSPLQR